MINLLVFILSLFAIYCVIRLFDAIFFGEKNGFFRRKLILKKRYTVFVREVIQFTGPILAEKRVKSYPSFELKYYKHKKYLGLYYGNQNSITVYVKGHLSVEELVDTVLHEICHHIQKVASIKEFKKYDRYSSEFGYFNNPLEIESREFAKKWAMPCISYLLQKKIIAYEK